MDPVTLNKRLNEGLQHQKANRVNEAEAIYKRILLEHPHDVDALHLQGLIELGRGRLDVAFSMLQRAVSLNPNFAACVRDLGQVLGLMGRHADARAAFARAVQLNPRDPDLLGDLAAALVNEGRIADALQPIRAALELNPNNAIQLANYGYLLGRLGQHEQAIEFTRRATQIDPGCAPAWVQYAEALWRAWKYPESIAPARRAVQLAPENAHAHLVLGNALQVAGEFEEACAEYRRVIQLQPQSFDAYNNLALTTLKMGEAHQAAQMYDQILARWPNERDALANNSLTRLTLGDYERGLAHYEARTTLAQFDEVRRAGKLWEGQDLAGKTILLAPEQGFGDTIQFIRYAPLVARRGGNVIAGSPAELVPVVRTVAGLSRVIPIGEPRPPIDYIIAMGSLPRIFSTRVDSIPADVPYMSAEPARVEQWRSRLAADSSVKIGIVWAGSRLHQNDRARSCRLIDFAPIAAVEGVSLYALQKGGAVDEMNDPQLPFKITPLGQDLNDFGDTAALLMNLDLLISVDTSVVHMAGALARPVWTIVARGPDWRWLLERQDTPWYPTMRLFRQKDLRQWAPVFDRIAAELRTFVQQARERKS
jgi:tetratricopeptide (TPR) repeat protein